MFLVLKTMSLGRTVLAAMCLACLTLVGCSTIMGDNFGDDYATWGENHRPIDRGDGMSGVSTKSQQIEKNLGVR
jgi:hypothetical protein